MICTRMDVRTLVADLMRCIVWMCFALGIFFAIAQQLVCAEVQCLLFVQRFSEVGQVCFVAPVGNPIGWQ